MQVAQNCSNRFTSPCFCQQTGCSILSPKKIRFYLSKSPQMKETGFDNSTNMFIKFKHRNKNNTQIFLEWTTKGPFMSKKGIVWPNTKSVSSISSEDLLLTTSAHPEDSPVTSVTSVQQTFVVSVFCWILVRNLNHIKQTVNSGFRWVDISVKMFSVVYWLCPEYRQSIKTCEVLTRGGKTQNIVLEQHYVYICTYK